MTMAETAEIAKRSAAARRRISDSYRPASRLSEAAEEIRRLSINEWGLKRAVDIVGRDESLGDVLRQAGKIARFDEPVLISGQSGVGKELMAQAIYLLDPKRRGMPFVSVNCPQYQEGNLTVSELFGHTKGSFTGATHDRKGCFETAHGGVIFLDEIGDLHMTAQTMLLRALATGEFQPLGSNQSKRVNVRVIAATNQPLEQMMEGQRFRNDLFFRLRYFMLRVPELAARGDDWRILADYVLDRLAATHAVCKEFSAESLDILDSHPWPGNVRELFNIVTMGYAMSESDWIEPDDFRELLFPEEGTASRASAEDPYRRMTVDGQSFWQAVHSRFMRRDLNRTQTREVIRRGLRATSGSYTDLLDHFNMEKGDYQKFMDFLRHHTLKPTG